MGYRTVVVFNNDLSTEWEKDSELGRKIQRSANQLWCRPDPSTPTFFRYGEVVEQVHADTQSVAFLDGYGGDIVAYDNFRQGEEEKERNIRLLKTLADKLGYFVSKKPTRGK